MGLVSAPGVNMSQVQAIVPQPATAMPLAVTDGAGTKGTSPRYATEDHTHASKARKGKATVSAATYTWVYPVPFEAGVTPIVNAIAQVPPGNADLFNVQLQGAPTNTQCQFQINRVSSSAGPNPGLPNLPNLPVGALGVNATPATITLHMLALEP